MIKINSATDITNKFTKILGFGEQSVVGLLEDGKNVAKCFRVPHDFTDKYDLLIGSKINQTSFCFFDDLYANSSFILGGKARFACGNKVSKKIQEVSFIDLIYSTLLLRHDINLISEAGIEVGDWKNFNMNFTDNEITITDIGRFKYSNKLPKQLYEYNAQMLFDVIRREYTYNPVIKEMIESNPKLKKLYLNSVMFPEFVEELRKYCNYYNHAENITQMQKNM